MVVASDDALVKSSSPGSNYGSLSYLRLRGASAPFYTTYLKFAVSGVSGAVQSATLRLYAYDGSDSGGAAYGVSNNYLDNSGPWTESGITWNNAPAISGTPLDTVGAVADDTWVEYDVTAAVTGNGTFSFGLDSASSNSLYLRAKEAADHHPELLLVLGPGASSTPASTATDTTVPTATDTPLPTATNTPGPSPTPSATATATATNTPGPSPTPTGTNTPQPTATNTALPTGTNTPLPTATNTSLPTATSTAMSTTVFGPSGDALVKSSSPNANYGSSAYLRLRGPSAPVYNTYLKFTVSGLSGTVQGATLRLYAYDGSDSGGSAYAASNNYIDDSGPWTESGITWNNAPAIGGTPLDTVGSVADNTWVEYDVTGAVTGNGTFSFGLQSLSTNSLYLRSNEASDNHPMLVVETSGGSFWYRLLTALRTGGLTP